MKKILAKKMLAKKALGLGFLALALTAGSAFAADLPNRKNAPQPYVAAAPAFNWTGGYAGVNAGYGFGSFSGSAGSQFKDPNNFVGGVQAGYNQQLPNKFVVGVEGDLDYSALEGKASASGVATGNKARIDTLGTVRGRVGYAFDRIMPYVTAGYAGGNEKITSTTGNASGWRNGYAVGGGVDYAITNNISARVEGLYVGLENKNVGTIGKVGNDIGLIRTGLNYKF
jgi:outer membrane immunogenic protein